MLNVNNLTIIKWNGGCFSHCKFMTRHPRLKTNNCLCKIRSRDICSTRNVFEQHLLDLTLVRPQNWHLFNCTLVQPYLKGNTCSAIKHARHSGHSKTGLRMAQAQMESGLWLRPEAGCLAMTALEKLSINFDNFDDPKAAPVSPAVINVFAAALVSFQQHSLVQMKSILDWRKSVLVTVTCG